MLPPPLRTKKFCREGGKEARDVFFMILFVKNVKCQMYVYSGHALSYTKLVHRHATQTERNKYFK